MSYARLCFIAFSFIGGIIWSLGPVMPDSAGLGNTVRFEQLITLATFLLLASLYGFYKEYNPIYSKFGKGGMWLLGIGIMGFVPISLRGNVEFTFAIGIVFIVAALIGGIVAEIGTILMAVDIWRTETPSKWMSVWFPLALPTTVVVNYIASNYLNIFHVLWNYHTGIFGFAWIGIGYHLLVDSMKGDRW